MDLCEPNFIEWFKSKLFTHVIHLAAISRVDDVEQDMELAYRNNVIASRAVMKAIAESKERCTIIFSSSREVYGNSKELCTEEMPLNPVNYYGKTKAEAEKLIIETAKRHSIPAYILRISNIYGSNRDNLNRFLPKLLTSINESSNFVLKGGNKILNFIHVHDLCNIIHSLLYKPHETVSIFNIASDKSISLIDIIHSISLAIPQFKYKIESAESYEVNTIYISNKKIKETLPNISFRNIKEYIKLNFLTLKGAL
jgi:nucleoside-diphosphate-sugar epimerase